jgi:hypothetical protein
MMKCKWCGKQFETQPHHGGQIRFCSEECREQGRKEAARIADRKWNEKNLEYHKNYYLVHKEKWDRTEEDRKRINEKLRGPGGDKQRARHREYMKRPEVRERANELIRKNRKDWQPERRRKIRERQRRWIEQNREHTREFKREYMKKRREQDVEFALEDRMRSICCAILQKQKAFKTVKLLGCSIGFLKNHLEAQFKDGMSWDNYGKNGWHIDHRVPVSWFRGLLHKPEWQQVVCHWTNLQPLWELENLRKGNRYAA